MRSRRPRTAVVLVAMACVLLAAIAVGQRLGENTLFSATQRRLDVPDVTITPVPDATPSDEPSLSKDWKRLQVVSVATDPAFPDPRVTPPPTPTPRPPPPTPRPTPTPSPSPPPADLYTSPPLPLPLASHDAEAPTPTPTPE
jgi:hypothetical protein